MIKLTIINSDSTLERIEEKSNGLCRMGRPWLVNIMVMAIQSGQIIQTEDTVCGDIIMAVCATGETKESKKSKLSNE